MIILSVVGAEHGPDLLSSDLAVENSSSISSEAELGMGTTLLSTSDFEKQTNVKEIGIINIKIYYLASARHNSAISKFVMTRKNGKLKAQIPDCFFPFDDSSRQTVLESPLQKEAAESAAMFLLWLF